MRNRYDKRGRSVSRAAEMFHAVDALITLGVLVALTCGMLVVLRVADWGHDAAA